MTEPKKKCPSCREWKPWSAYGVEKRLGIPRSYCRPCESVKAREWQKKNRERLNAAQRRKYQQIRADPERYAVLLEQKREWRRRKHGTTPDRYRIDSRAHRTEAPGTNGLVDAEPFTAWLRTMEGSSQEIGNRLKIEPAIVRRLLKGDSRYVSIDTVDRACQEAGEPWLIHEMYPLEEAA